MQHKRKGNPPRPISERFWEHVDQGPGLGPQGDCYEWRGWTNPQGYGRMSIGSRADGSRRFVLTHRLAWFVAHGEWPVENVLHRCDNPPCVRLDHLFQGTGADNTHDMLAKGREASGERNGNAKLTWAKVDLIRADSRPLREVAHDFGVSNIAIWRVRHGRTWRTNR